MGIVLGTIHPKEQYPNVATILIDVWVSVNLNALFYDNGDLCKMARICMRKSSIMSSDVWPIEYIRVRTHLA